MYKFLLKILQDELERSQKSLTGHLCLNERFISDSYLRNAYNDITEYLIYNERFKKYPIDVLIEYIKKMEQDSLNAKSDEISYMFSIYHDTALYIFDTIMYSKSKHMQTKTEAEQLKKYSRIAESLYSKTV